MANINSEVISPVTDNLVELFAVDLTLYGDQVYYFINASLDTGPVLWQGNEYVPTSFETEGFEMSNTGEAASPKVRFSVTNQVITALINDYNDLIGAKITRTRTYKKFLDNGSDPNPSAHLPLDIFRVERKVKENKLMVEFELSTIMDQQGRQLPARAMTANYCPWRYRVHNGGTSGNPLNDFTYVPSDNKCPYVGSNYFDDQNEATTAVNDKCSKTVKGCKVRFGADNELPFGGFPGVARPSFG